MKTGDTHNHFERGARLAVKEGYYDAGRRGTGLGPSIYKEQFWTPIVWDEEDDPTFFKSVGLTRAQGKD